MNLIQIENRKGKLSLNDTVHKESADKLIEELGKLYGQAAVAAHMQIGEVVCSADKALEAVEVTINSPGGSVLEGTRIYNALRGMSSRGVAITTTVDGLAASMGSVILMAGDERRMVKGSRVMIHEASTMAWGDARVMRKNADLLEGISSEISGIYAERTGGDAKAIRDLMYDETWMDAEKAKSLGFVHAVIDYDKPGKENASAHVDIRAAAAKPAPMSLLNKLYPGKNEAEIEALIADADSLRADLTAAQVQIESLQAQVIEKDGLLASQLAAIQTRDTDLATLTAQVTDLESALESAAKELVAKDEAIQAAAESAGKLAAENLAAIGQPEPLAVEAQSNTDPVALYIAAVESGATKLRAEIFAKHKDAIMAHRAKLNQ